MSCHVDENMLLKEVLKKRKILIICVVNDKETENIGDLKCVYINDCGNILLKDKSEYVGKRLGKSLMHIIKMGIVCNIYNDIYIMTHI